MRVFTYALCALACSLVCTDADAQIFRGLRPFASSRRACANGSCDVPTFVQAAPAKPSVPNVGVTDLVGVKGEIVTKEPVPDRTGPAKAELPIEQAPGVEEIQPDLFGVEWDYIENKKYQDKDSAITLRESIEFVRGIYDEQKKLVRLVVIGTPAERGPVLAAFESLPAFDRAKISPWFVSADHWSLRDSDGSTVRFEVHGKPSVYLLAPDGKTIHRQDGWTSQQDADAIRKGLKKYDPKRDPDLRRNPEPERIPVIGWRRTVKRVTPVALIAGGAALGLYFLGRRKF